MQVRENGAVTGFHILWALPENSVPMEERVHFSFPPANAPGESQIWSPWPSVSSGANRPCLCRRAFGSSDSAWGGLFQARWPEDSPSPADGQHNPGSLCVRSARKWVLGNTSFLTLRVWLPILLFGISPVETPNVKRTHLLQVPRNVTQSG